MAWVSVCQIEQQLPVQKELYVQPTSFYSEPNYYQYYSMYYEMTQKPLFREVEKHLNPTVAEQYWVLVATVNMQQLL